MVNVYLKGGGFKFAHPGCLHVQSIKYYVDTRHLPHNSSIITVTILKYVLVFASRIQDSDIKLVDAKTYLHPLAAYFLKLNVFPLVNL